jgi:hypothetical protein
MKKKKDLRSPVVKANVMKEFLDPSDEERLNIAPIQLKGLSGRPETPIDKEIWAKLAFLNPSMPEMAAFFNMSLEGLRKRCEKDPELVELIDKGKQAMKTSIRRAILRLAMTGDTKMLTLLAQQPDLLAWQVDKNKERDNNGLSKEEVKQALLGAFEAAQVINEQMELEKRTVNQYIT